MGRGVVTPRRFYYYFGPGTRLTGGGVSHTWHLGESPKYIVHGAGGAKYLATRVRAQVW
jgi:hypothetical protein